MTRFSRAALSLALIAACADPPSQLVGSQAGGGGAPSGGAPGVDADGGASNPSNPGDPGGGAPTPPSTLPPVSSCTSSAATAPGPRLLRRLTASQLNASLRDLFRDPSVPQATFLNDPPALGFQVDAAALVVQDVMAQQLMDFTDQVATWVDAHQAAVTSCKTTDATCRQQFIRAFGKRAFRAPLTDAQVQTYETLLTSQTSFTDSVHVVVQAMLQSPYFLYRRELGAPSANGLYTLTPYEVAASLAYLLVGSTPDDALMAAADSGQLATPAQIDAQIARLLQDPRAHAGVSSFMGGWLGLDRVGTSVKDTSVYGALTPALRQSMLNETTSLLLDVFDKHWTFADALTATYTFVDQGLASFYGIGGANGSQPTKVTLQPGQRNPGLLAHGSLLAGYATATSSSPVQRGKLVRTRLLCETLPPPPGGVPTDLVPPSGVQTTRQHYEAHSKNAPCSGCHKFIDPVGFPFESYDGIGRYRSSENGLPIDPSGQLVSLSGQPDVSFAGLDDLSHYLAASDQVKSCMVRYWSYFAYGEASWDQDGCTQDGIRAEATTKGFTLESVLEAIVHSPHFTSRTKDQ